MSKTAFLLILIGSLLSGCSQKKETVPEDEVPVEGITCSYYGAPVLPGSSVSGYASSSVNFGQTCQTITATCNGSTGELSTQPLRECTVMAPKKCSYYGEVYSAGQTVSGFVNIIVPYGGSCQSLVGTCDGATGKFDVIPEQQCSVNQPVSCSYNNIAYSDGQQVFGFSRNLVAPTESCVAMTGICRGIDGHIDNQPLSPTCAVAPASSCQLDGITVLSEESVIAYSSRSSTTKFCDELKEVRTCLNGSFTNGSYPYSSCSENPMIFNVTIPEGHVFDVFISASQNQTVRKPRISWGDGTYSDVPYVTSFGAEPKHEYENSGEYQIKILGNWKRALGGVLTFTGPDTTEQICPLPLTGLHVSEEAGGNTVPVYSATTKVLSWGDNILPSHACLFFSEELLTELPAIPPNLSQSNNMDYMLAGTKINQPLNWSTNKITSMRGVFWQNENFNQPLNWDVALVNSMDYMFQSATGFNQPLDFRTSENLTSTVRMFTGATNFDSPVLLNTSKVTNMRLMFASATSFNQPLNFDTSEVTNMNSMFNTASSFSQDLSLLCVTKIPNKPTGYDGSTLSSWLTTMKPQWGTCTHP